MCVHICIYIYIHMLYDIYICYMIYTYHIEQRSAVEQSAAKT